MNRSKIRYAEVLTSIKYLNIARDDTNTGTIATILKIFTVYFKDIIKIIKIPFLKLRAFI
jgi:hypothetical protein|tara:strand:- start:36 stop:215 length:180 start_codon:yes stop_codon:yes gene_type:complete